jgi:hypothetical protein
MKKRFFLLIGGAIVIAAIILFGFLFNPGTYHDVEKYDFNCSDSILIECVRKFKKDNSSYCVPQQTGLIDGYDDSRALWYHIYFYVPDSDLGFHCWIRSFYRGKATLALVAVSPGISLTGWKLINKDLETEDNEKYKHIFENSILNKLKRFDCK